MATLTFKYPVKIDGKIYKAGEPVDEQLVAEGAKAEQDETPKETAPFDNAEQGETDGEDDGTDVELTGMSLEQLKKFAKDNGFNIKGCTTKTAIIEAIEAATKA